MKMANCGASVKSSQKPKKMNQGGFMKIGDDLQMLDVNRDKKRMGMSSGGIAERKRKEEAEERERAIARLVGFAQWGIASLLVFGSALGLLYWSWANYG